MGNVLVFVIAACEVGFWVLLGAGLGARYLLRARVLSTLVLVLVPVLDLVLVSASLLDVAGGAPPRGTHGLAAVYLGFTVAFGRSTMAWADARMAHRFAGGPPPARPPRSGPARFAYEWREWGRAVLGGGIALAVTGLTAAVAGTGVPAPGAWAADPLWSWARWVVLAAIVWFIAGPLWSTVSRPSGDDASAPRVRY